MSGVSNSPPTFYHAETSYPSAVPPITLCAPYLGLPQLPLNDTHVFGLQWESGLLGLSLLSNVVTWHSALQVHQLAMAVPIPTAVITQELSRLLEAQYIKKVSRILFCLNMKSPSSFQHEAVYLGWFLWHSSPRGERALFVQYSQSSVHSIYNWSWLLGTYSKSSIWSAPQEFFLAADAGTDFTTRSMDYSWWLKTGPLSLSHIA